MKNDLLHGIIDARFKSLEKSLDAWQKLKTHIWPLLPENEKVLASEVNNHFLMLPAEDMVLITALTSQLLIFPKMFCLKCEKEIDKEGKVL